MPSKILDDAVNEARTLGIEACWRQWAALGSPATSQATGRATAIIDPEALIFLSVCLQDHERRLRDFVGWWARAGSRFTSVQRAKTIGGQFPEKVQADFVGFATAALDAGDRRWKAQAGTASVVPSRPKGMDKLDFTEPSTLMVRLRAGFGVGAKADVLTYLIGLGGAWSTTSRISFATGYTQTAVREAVEAMSLARLVRSTEERPVQYFAHPDAWASVLELQDIESLPHVVARPPRWRSWSGIFAFLADVGTLSEESGAIDPYLQSSKARDLFEKSKRAFTANNIETPLPSKYPGVKFLEGYRETVRVVCDWVKSNL